METRNLLLALDLGPTTEPLCVRAADLVAERPSRVTALHVAPDRRRGEAMRWRERRLSEVWHHLTRLGVDDFTIDVVLGDPATSVVAYAKAHRADLILMGRRGDGEVGEVARAVLDDGTVEVVLVAPEPPPVLTARPTNTPLLRNAR